MPPATQTIIGKGPAKVDYSEKSSIDILYDELARGIKSLKEDNVYTIEEAWEEIDKI